MPTLAESYKRAMASQSQQDAAMLMRIGSMADTHSASASSLASLARQLSDISSPEYDNTRRQDSRTTSVDFSKTLPAATACDTPRLSPSAQEQHGPSMRHAVQHQQHYPFTPAGSNQFHPASRSRDRFQLHLSPIPAGAPMDAAYPVAPAVGEYAVAGAQTLLSPASAAVDAHLHQQQLDLYPAAAAAAYLQHGNFRMHAAQSNANSSTDVQFAGSSSLLQRNGSGGSSSSSGGSSNSTRSRRASCCVVPDSHYQQRLLQLQLLMQKEQQLQAELQQMQHIEEQQQQQIAAMSSQIPAASIQHRHRRASCSGTAESGALWWQQQQLQQPLSMKQQQQQQWLLQDQSTVAARPRRASYCAASFSEYVKQRQHQHLHMADDVMFHDRMSREVPRSSMDDNILFAPQPTLTWQQQQQQQDLAVTHARKPRRASCCVVSDRHYELQLQLQDQQQQQRAAHADHMYGLALQQQQSESSIARRQRRASCCVLPTAHPHSQHAQHADISMLRYAQQRSRSQPGADADSCAYHTASSNIGNIRLQHQQHLPQPAMHGNRRMGLELRPERGLNLGPLAFKTDHMTAVQEEQHKVPWSVKASPAAAAVSQGQQYAAEHAGSSGSSCNSSRLAPMCRSSFETAARAPVAYTATTAAASMLQQQKQQGQQEQLLLAAAAAGKCMDMCRQSSLSNSCASDDTMETVQSAGPDLTAASGQPDILPQATTQLGLMIVPGQPGDCMYTKPVTAQPDILPGMTNPGLMTVPGQPGRDTQMTNLGDLRAAGLQSCNNTSAAAAAAIADIGATARGVDACSLHCAAASLSESLEVICSELGQLLDLQGKLAIAAAAAAPGSAAAAACAAAQVKNDETIHRAVAAKAALEAARSL